MIPAGDYKHFVALRVPAPEGLDLALGGAPQEFRRSHPEDLHATLAFLGCIDPGITDSLLEAVAEIPFTPTTIRLGPLVALPNRHRCSAFAFEFDEGREILVELIRTVRRPLLEMVGARPDHRPPYPHLTVGRPPRRPSKDLLARLLNWTDSVRPPTGRVEISELLLYRSRSLEDRRFEVLGP